MYAKGKAKESDFKTEEGADENDPPRSLEARRRVVKRALGVPEALDCRYRNPSAKLGGAGSSPDERVAVSCTPGRAGVPAPLANAFNQRLPLQAWKGQPAAQRAAAALLSQPPTG